MFLVLVAAVAVDLAANFTTGPQRAVDVHVGGACADGVDQLIDLARVDTLSPRCGSCRDVRADVSRYDSAGYGRRWRRTRLSSSRTIAEVGAEKYADAAVNALLSKVDVGLLNGAFEISVAEFPIDSGSVVADPGIKIARGSGRDRRNFLITGEKLADFLEALRPRNG